MIAFLVELIKLVIGERSIRGAQLLNGSPNEQAIFLDHSGKLREGGGGKYEFVLNAVHARCFLTFRSIYVQALFPVRSSACASFPSRRSNVDVNRALWGLVHVHTSFANQCSFLSPLTTVPGIQYLSTSKIKKLQLQLQHLISQIYETAVKINNTKACRPQQKLQKAKRMILTCGPPAQVYATLMPLTVGAKPGHSPAGWYSVAGGEGA